jgi:hypothetical protein
LEKVTTIPDAARRWNRATKTIEMQIAKGNLVAAKVGGTWLVSVYTLALLWGEPTQDDIMEVTYND